MISINLIPDVKLEMLRAQRMRNVAISISILAGIAAGIIVAIMAGIVGTQLAVEAVTNKTIDSEYQKLSSVDGINDALTIQNQLTQISDINSNKTRDSRLLDIISAINPPSPNDMKFSKISLDPSTSTLTIEGSATGGYSATDVFRKTILHTTVESKTDESSDTTSEPLTSDVTLNNASFGKDTSGKSVLSFTVSFTYPQDLFSNLLQSVKIVTPTARTDVTDSKTRVPDSLFTTRPTSGEDD